MALGRWMRRGGLGIAAVLAVWGVLWLVAYTLTDRSGWARAITWMDSDVDDLCPVGERQTAGGRAADGEPFTTAVVRIAVVRVPTGPGAHTFAGNRQAHFLRRLGLDDPVVAFHQLVGQHGFEKDPQADDEQQGGHGEQA